MTYPSIDDYNQACSSRRRFRRLSGERYRFVRFGSRFVFSSGAFACVMKLASCAEFGRISEEAEKELKRISSEGEEGLGGAEAERRTRKVKAEADQKVKEAIESNPADLEFHAVRLLMREQHDLIKRYSKFSEFVKGNPGLSPLLLQTSVFEGEYNFRHGADVNPSDISRDELLPVIRMEWCSGVTLGVFVAECCQRGDVRNLAAVRGLIAGLGQASRKAQFVHGDLSPENILVLDSEGDIELKLVDYDSVLFPGVEDLPSSVGLTQMRHPKAMNRSFDDDLVALAIYDLGLAYLIERHSDVSGLNPADPVESSSLSGLFEQRFVLGRDDFMAAPEDRSPLAKKVYHFAPERFDRIRTCLMGSYESCGDLADFADGVVATSGYFRHQEESQRRFVDQFLDWINEGRYELWDQEPNYLIRDAFYGVVAYKFFASEKTYEEAKAIAIRSQFSLPLAIPDVDARFLAEEPRLEGQWIWFNTSHGSDKPIPWFGKGPDSDSKFMFVTGRKPTDKLLAVGTKKFRSEVDFLASERRTWHQRILYSCPVDVSLAPENYFGKLKFGLDFLFESLVRRRDFVEMLWQGIEIVLIADWLQNAFSLEFNRDKVAQAIYNRFARVVREDLLRDAGVKVEIDTRFFRLVRLG